MSGSPPSWPGSGTSDDAGAEFSLGSPSSLRGGVLVSAWAEGSSRARAVDKDNSVVGVSKRLKKIGLFTDWVVDTTPLRQE